MSDSASAPPSHAAAKGVAIGLGVLLILGTMVLVVMLVMGPRPAESPSLPEAIVLAPGDRVLSADLAGDQLLLTVGGEDASEGARALIVIDQKTGKKKRIALARGQASQP